jgi:nucleoside-diphosphate-sugar epimerase
MILVTGATGLVGSHLILTLLENKATVRAIYRHDLSIAKTRAIFELYDKGFLFHKIQWIKADITDVTSLDAAFANIEYVYHCAALISFDPSDEQLLRKTNIEGTANLVNFCIEHQIKKLCFVSSIATLGDLKEHETIISEETEWNPELPHSDYAISKYGAEMEVWRGREEGLKVVIVNPGVIIGPGFWESGSGQLFTKVKNGMLFYTRGATGFVGIHDVVKCLVYCMNNPTKEERFCLIAENLSFDFILKTMAKAMMANPPKLYAGIYLTAIAWRADWLFSLLLRKKRTLSKLMAKSLHQKNRYANNKIKSIYLVPFENIEQCIMNCAELYLKQRSTELVAHQNQLDLKV